MNVKTNKPQTLVLHAGPRSDLTTGAVAVPIFQTASYQFRGTEHAANLFALKEFGNIYSRIMNPTCDALEQKVAALEGGVAALAVSSGQAASAMAIQNLCRPGDNVVSSTDLYGGTWNLFANTLPSMGITVRFADPADPESFRRATDDRTRAYYAETLPNPKLTVFPIGEVAAIGRELGVPLIMDNTAAPTICRPFDHGVAIVVHSTTKYIGGHGTSIGGIIVDGGNFDWVAARALPNAERTRSELSWCRLDARTLPQRGRGRTLSAPPPGSRPRDLPRSARRCRAAPPRQRLSQRLWWSRRFRAQTRPRGRRAIY
jgi:O-acetylhomoserine (thiol)-lyase